MSFDISLINQIRETIHENPQLRCFPIGATYLQERYTKEARGTSDIDFVVVPKGKINQVKLEKMIIKQMQSLKCGVNSQSNNPLRFKTTRNINVHIYPHKIGDFDISKNMLNRVNENRQFCIEDYVFLKLLPVEREKDRSDIIFILQKNPPFRWEILLGELENQLETYEQKFGSGVTYNKVVEIGNTLELIRDEYPDLIPQESMDTLTKILDHYDSRLKLKEK